MQGRELTHPLLCTELCLLYRDESGIKLIIHSIHCGAAFNLCFHFLPYSSLISICCKFIVYCLILSICTNAIKVCTANLFSVYFCLIVQVCEVETYNLKNGQLFNCTSDACLLEIIYF